MRGPSCYSRIKPMAFEYDRTKRFATMKWKFVYFFNSSIVVEAISAGRRNSAICGSPIGPTLLVACCVKAISIHVVTGKWLDPMGKSVSNLSQLVTHGRIGLCLQDQAGYIVILLERTKNVEVSRSYLGHYLLSKPRNEIGPPLSCTPWNKSISFMGCRIPWFIPE
jgi:hypothetical protein